MVNISRARSADGTSMFSNNLQVNVGAIYAHTKDSCTSLLHYNPFAAPV